MADASSSSSAATMASAATAAARVRDLLAASDPQQVQMMSEECIVVDESDRVIGHASKTETHLNEAIESRGLLHRAFSVFLFNDAGELLMQQRAASKITFPRVWANTCCSHPLFCDAELEEREQAGVRAAAVRKLQQELGVAQLSPRDFNYVTRVHYRARSDDVWGEHEIDYILFARAPPSLTLNPNPNEVASVRWFSQKQLREWIARSAAGGDLISPWFLAIAQYKLFDWWTAFLQGSLHEHLDHVSIYRAPSAASTHSGAATPTPTSATATVTAKQGAYGRVRVYAPPMWQSLVRPLELFAMLRFKFGGGLGGGPVRASETACAQERDDFLFCDDMLVRVSRSFAAVIQQLPDALRRAVCIFYLVLRALDTVEDDTAVQRDLKLRLLNEFHTHLPAATRIVREARSRDGQASADVPDAALFSLTGIGAGSERTLLEQYPKVLRAFASLDDVSQRIIADITRRMAAGMAEFVFKDLGQGTLTCAEYDRYCHYVAGLVGEGLSGLFSASGREDKSLAAQLEVSNHMGLFLQKTNIIRDYLEDFVEGRAFWPKDIWSQYAPDLGDLARPERIGDALQCLTHLICNAMQHAPYCLQYLSMLRDPSVFRFCAIPQLMAIATLERCLREPRVFSGVVKIRKGLSVRMIRDCGSMASVYAWFRHFALRMHDKAVAASRLDRNSAEMANAARRLLAITADPTVAPSSLARRPDHSPELSPGLFWIGTTLSAVVLSYSLYHLSQRARTKESFFPKLTEPLDVAVLGSAIAALVFMLAFCGVPHAHLSVAQARKARKLAALGTPHAGSSYTVPTSKSTTAIPTTGATAPVARAAAAAAAAAAPATRTSSRRVE